MGRVVHGVTDRMTVFSVVIYILILRGHILIIGRTNGYWGYGRLAGVLCCLLYGHFSSTSPTSGAIIVVAGSSGGVLVHSAVLWILIRHGCLLPLGRIRPYLGVGGKMIHTPDPNARSMIVIRRSQMSMTQFNIIWCAVLSIIEAV